MKSITFCALLLLLCGCIPRYHESPWADCIYSPSTGKAYVMQGTETIKTTTLLTGDGTFKEFSFPVKRQFHLLERGETSKDLGHFVFKTYDSIPSHYSFFPESNTLITLEDYACRLQNLTLRKSQRVDGTFLNVDRNPSRYCLVKSDTANYISKLDKVTSQSVKLTKASADFVGDTMYVDLFLSEDGHRIIRAESDNSKKTITISAWDMQKETLLVKPHTVSYINEFRNETRVLYCEADDHSILMMVCAAKDYSSSILKVSIKSFTPSSFAVRQNMMVELEAWNTRAFKDGSDTVAILYYVPEKPNQARYRWELKRYDLTTGECILTDTIEGPAIQPK